jgi:hypothetical protein
MCHVTGAWKKAAGELPERQHVHQHNLCFVVTNRYIRTNIASTKSKGCQPRQLQARELITAGLGSSAEPIAVRQYQTNSALFAALPETFAWLAVLYVTLTKEDVRDVAQIQLPTAVGFSHVESPSMVGGSHPDFANPKNLTRPGVPGRTIKACSRVCLCAAFWLD